METTACGWINIYKSIVTEKHMIECTFSFHNINSVPFAFSIKSFSKAVFTKIQGFEQIMAIILVFFKICYVTSK